MNESLKADWVRTAQDKKSEHQTMGGYFKPLRRKIGVLTLMAACLFVGLWIRSFSVADHVSVPIGDLTFESILCANASVLWSRMSLPESDGSPLKPRWATTTATEAQKFLEDPNLVWRWQWNGWAAIEYDALRLHAQLKMSGLVIPYWSFVIPLSLVSAWLLLVNARNPIQTRREPTPASGA